MDQRLRNSPSSAREMMWEARTVLSVISWDPDDSPLEMIYGEEFGLGF